MDEKKKQEIRYLLSELERLLCIRDEFAIAIDGLLRSTELALAHTCQEARDEAVEDRKDSC